ncbi:uncharacterized protein [Dermacentor albipictus]|uniref:uncharacterized protein n=1 Tax=Dermacentor albipictus TaxID=60249 RepID=UPI0038FD028A
MKKDADPTMFFRYYRMTPPKFNELHKLVKRDLVKSFLCREPLCSEERLAITLRYLSSGSAVKQIAMNFRVAPSTCHVVIHHTCKVLWRHLQSLYLPEPGLAQWQNIAEKFSRRWNFPNCIGAVDGKHIQIKAPPNSGSKYFNYKSTFSIVLMAIVDASYRFIMLDVGAAGRHSDGGVFKASSFGRQLGNEDLNLPVPAGLPNSNNVAPHVFVGDEAFQLRPDFLRPYPGKHLTPTQRVFNYRLSRASEATYCPPGYAAVEDDYGNIVPAQWRTEIQRRDLLDLEATPSRNYSASAAATRNMFAQYFMNEGAVTWQWAHTGLPPPPKT